MLLPVPAQQVAVEDQDPHRRGSFRDLGCYPSAPMPARQKYRLRARSDREVIREVEPGSGYVDRETGEEFKVVGKVLPLAPSPSDLP